MKVPKEIRIGAYDYQVKYVPRLVYDYKLLGQSLADSQIIKIEPDTTAQTKEVTLWHEIIHGIGDVYNCDIDEKNIDRLAQGIVAVLRNSFSVQFDWQDIEEG